MRKTVFLLMFLVLTAIGGRVSYVAATSIEEEAVANCDGYCNTDLPLGEGEESSGSDKDVAEDDDDAGLDHRLHSRELSGSSDLHIIYQEILFQNLESEIVIPPPRG